MCLRYFAFLIAFFIPYLQCSTSLIVRRQFSKAMPKKVAQGSAVRTQQAAPPKVKSGTAAELSRETEEFIMTVLRGRQEGPIRERSACEAKPALNMKQLGKIWDELLQLGFSKEDAEMGIRESSSESLASVLDWLCLNLDEDRYDTNSVIIARMLFATSDA